MKGALALLIVIFFSAVAVAQTGAYRVKSWKAGTAQAKPQTLTVDLNTSERVYSRVITNASGQPLYRLLVSPAAFIGPGDGVVAWHVFLTLPDSEENLLIPSNSLEQEEYEGPDYLWWFYPGKNRLVPIEAARTVQVEGSYVTLKAEGIKLSGTGQLEGMRLTIAFSNTPP